MAGKRRATRADEIIGAFLREKRVEAGLSQTAMGEALGVSFQQIQKREHGTNRVSVAAFVKAARALQTAPSSLLQEVEGRL